MTDKRKASRAGRFVEILGNYNPSTKRTSVKKERVLYWIGKGAQPSDSVHNLLVKAKVIEGKKKAVHAKSKKTKEPEKPAAVAPTTEQSKVEAPAEKIEPAAGA